MKLTEEQNNIIHAEGNLKINAVAGSGKTTTLIEYARARSGQKILYIAFNSSVRKSAKEKFSSLGLSNIRVETAHSLAFDRIVKRSNFKLQSSYKINEIKEILKINPVGRDWNTPFIIANHIKKFTAFFCNSDKEKVNELDYLSLIDDPLAKEFATRFYEQIEYGTRLFLALMLKGEINITHDFYLKLFQLRQPLLNYDFILFDEGQDASPAMLDVFLKQKSTKVIVGDTHQQIYGWRYAINSLNKVTGFNNYALNTSFRLDEEMSELAMNILNWKTHFSEYNGNKIIGLGKNRTIETHAVLARTNLKLLVNAIEKVTGLYRPAKIYFEGNLNSYTYAGEGASLYDVLNLSEGHHHLIRDELIKKMKGMNELKEYAEKSEEAELGMLIDIVDEYGKELPRLMKLLKERHLPDADRNKAEIIFSTVHRCKGLEYDEVTLEKDFISEEGILKLIKNEKIDSLDLNKLAEEVNLLYVAVTRTRSKLKIPEELTNAATHSLMLNSKKHALISGKGNRYQSDKKPASKVKDNRSFEIYQLYKAKKSGSKNKKKKIEYWTNDLDAELKNRISKKQGLYQISEAMGAAKTSIERRMNQLGLFDKFGLVAEEFHNS